MQQQVFVGLRRTLRVRTDVHITAGALATAETASYSGSGGAMSAKREPVAMNCATPNERPRTLREVVTYYRRDHRAALVELESCRRYQPFEDAVRTAALSMARSGDGSIKRHLHQRRIPLRVLRRAAARLSRATDELKRSLDFDELIRIVDKRPVNPRDW